MTKARKPKGWKAFAALARLLVGVPKGEADQQVAKSKSDRLRRRKIRRGKKK